MTGVLLALGSAVLYGISDFVGGLASRRANFIAVALVGQLTGLLVAGVAAAVVITRSLAIADLGWGALSGIGTAAGMVFLFRGLSRDKMAVVVPTSAVTGVSLPVLVGVLLEHEQPSPLAWAGIVVALPALWLVSGDSPQPDATAGSTGAKNGLLAGVGIALQYLALARASEASGLWSVAAGRVTAVCMLVGLLFVLAQRRPGEKQRLTLRMPRETRMYAVLAGATAAGALAAYLLATQHQLTVVAVVLSSLYPVIPVLLGITVLHEHVSRRQTIGLLAAGAATALLAI